MNRAMLESRWRYLKEKGVLQEKDIKLASDWEKRYCQGRDDKYGCLMYSPSLEKLRYVTFSEFYGNGVVD